MKLKAMLLIAAITTAPFLIIGWLYPQLGIFSGELDLGLERSMGACVLMNLPCISWRLQSPNADLNVAIANGLDREVVVTRIACSKNPELFFGCGTALGGRRTVCNQKDPSAKEALMRPGGENEFSLFCTDGEGNPVRLAKGGAYTGKINIEYYYVDDPSHSPIRLHGDLLEEAG